MRRASFRSRVRSRVRSLALAAALVAVAGAPAYAQKRQRDLVTREELLASAQKEGDLYAALRSLRPRFLEPPAGIRTLGNAVQVPTAVVVDGRYMGGLEVLKTIPAATVNTARYYEPSRAANEFGPKAEGGAVAVTLFKGVDKPKPDSTPTR